jgi:hypothetical protein
MSSIIIDVKYIIQKRGLETPRQATLVPISNVSKVLGAVQKIKTAASTISTITPTPRAKSWPVTLWK